MSVFNVAKVEGQFGHQGEVGVYVCNGTEGSAKREPFSVCIDHRGGAAHFSFHMTPDQSRRLRAALEDAEAKAEILTAEI